MFGAVERGLGNIFLATVEKRDEYTLGRLIKNFISESAIIYSDSWPAYLAYFSKDGIQEHNYVNHSKNFLKPNNKEVHTQTIEGLWNILKK